MASSLRGQHLREWGSLAAALALGPAFVVVGYQMGLVFRPAAAAYALVCALAVPLLTIAGGRFKFVVWQIAVISMTFAVMGDGVRLNAMHRGEIPSVAYVFWASGTLLSCPLPIYFLLRPMAAHQRYILGFAIVAIGLALWLVLKKITG